MEPALLCCGRGRNKGRTVVERACGAGDSAVVFQRHDMARSEGSRIFRFFRKPLLLLPCCGSASNVSVPGSRVAPEEPDALNRRESCRPSSLHLRDEILSKSEDASETHPYHCPICFYFFAEMNRTECCKHHLCRDCAVEIMERIPAFRAGYGADGVQTLRPAPCPHCGHENMRLITIRSREEARSYNDSPAVLNRTRGLTPVLSVQPSPLKVGDSMDNMMRKMLTYDQCGINIRADQRFSVLGDMTTPGRDSPPLYEQGADPNNPHGLLPGVPCPPLPEDCVGSDADPRSPAETQVQVPSPAVSLHGEHELGDEAEAEALKASQRRAASLLIAEPPELADRNAISINISASLRPLPPILGADHLTGTGGSGRPPLPGGGGLVAGARGMAATRSRSQSRSPVPPRSPPPAEDPAVGEAAAAVGDEGAEHRPLPEGGGEQIEWEVRS